MTTQLSFKKAKLILAFLKIIWVFKFNKKIIKIAKVYNMCGITGILNFNPSENVRLGMLKNMTDSINHRGPDDEGHYINNNLGLVLKDMMLLI